MKQENERYYITMINAKRLKRICALHHVKLHEEQGDNKIDYYITVDVLGTFIRVMRDHKIDVLFC